VGRQGWTFLTAEDEEKKKNYERTWTGIRCDEEKRPIMHFFTILFPLFDANNILDRDKPLVLFFFLRLVCLPRALFLFYKSHAAD